MNSDEKDIVKILGGVFVFAIVFMFIASTIATCTEQNSKSRYKCEEVKTSQYCSCRKKLDHPFWKWRWQCEE